MRRGRRKKPRILPLGPGCLFSAFFKPGASNLADLGGLAGGGSERVGKSKLHSSANLKPLNSERRAPGIEPGPLECKTLWLTWFWLAKHMVWDLVLACKKSGLGEDVNLLLGHADLLLDHADFLLDHADLLFEYADFLLDYADLLLGNADFLDLF